MARMDSKVATEKSLKDEDETMEDKDETATSKIDYDPDKQQGVTTSPRRRSSRAKSNPASPVPPAVKMEIDNEDEVEKKKSSTERESNQQATTKMETGEKPLGSDVPAPPAAEQEKKDGTSATSTPADSNASAKSQSKTQSEPTEDIAKTEDTPKDSENDKNDDDDDEIQNETPDDSEDYHDAVENEEEDSSETKATGKRRRGKSTEPRPTDSPGRTKRVRNKPIALYKPVDFGMPKEKATNPKGQAKAKKSASQSRSSSAPPQKTKGDYITIINGQGMKLRDIPVICKTVEESDINSQDLYLVHRLLYSYKGRGYNKVFKTHILEFSGYMRKAKEGENEEKVDEENASHEAFMSAKVFKYDIPRLKLYMDFFQIDRKPTEDGPLNKEALVDRLLDFLCAPSLESMNPPEDSSSEEEEDSGDGDEMRNEKKDDAKTTKATEVKSDDKAAPETAPVAKKDDADTTTKVTESKTEDAVTAKKAETKAVVSEEPKKKDVAETTESKEAQKDTETSTKAQTKEKQVPKKDSKEKVKIESDPANSKDGDDKDQAAAGTTANAQTYQEWCQKAKIEGAFYLVREHDKGDEPSDAAIRQWVQAYVTCFDMSAATAKHAIETASAKFGVNLRDRKDLIREFIVSEI